MDMITLYERIPILFWLTIILVFLSLVPLLVWVYMALFESLNDNFKFLKPHIIPEDIKNKSASCIQNKHCEPRNPQISIYSQNGDTDDPNDNHGGWAGRR